MGKRGVRNVGGGVERRDLREEKEGEEEEARREEAEVDRWEGCGRRLVGGFCDGSCKHSPQDVGQDKIERTGLDGESEEDCDRHLESEREEWQQSWVDRTPASLLPCQSLLVTHCDRAEGESRQSAQDIGNHVAEQWEIRREGAQDESGDNCRRLQR